MLKRVYTVERKSCILIGFPLSLDCFTCLGRNNDGIYTNVKKEIILNSLDLKRVSTVWSKG